MVALLQQTLFMLRESFPYPKQPKYGHCPLPPPEPLKVENVKMHICAKCSILFLLNPKQKNRHLLLIWVQFDNTLQFCTCFYGILNPPNSANFSVRHFACVKYSFVRRSHPIAPLRKPYLISLFTYLTDPVQLGLFYKQPCD